jgi:Terpene cyclase DEP1
MLIRHSLYLVAAILSLAWAWSLGLVWVAEGGNLLNLPSFFADAYRSGSAAGFLTIDILFVWGVFMVWVVSDARQIGLGTKWGLGFIALSFLGTCFAFPLYLIARERHLARQG